MNAEQFAYWLQGYAELTNEAPTKEQWDLIKEHLNLVFTKVTGPTFPKELHGWGTPTWVNPDPLGQRTYC